MIVAITIMIYTLLSNILLVLLDFMPKKLSYTSTRTVNCYPLLLFTSRILINTNSVLFLT